MPVLAAADYPCSPVPRPTWVDFELSAPILNVVREWHVLELRIDAMWWRQLCVGAGCEGEQGGS